MLCVEVFGMMLSGVWCMQGVRGRSLWSVMLSRSRYYENICERLRSTSMTCKAPDEAPTLGVYVTSSIDASQTRMSHTRPHMTHLASLCTAAFVNQ